MTRPNGSREPLKTLLVFRRVRQQRTRIAKSNRAKSLQLPPDLNALTRLARGQGEDQQEPSCILWHRCYIHNTRLLRDSSGCLKLIPRLLSAGQDVGSGFSRSKCSVVSFGASSSLGCGDSLLAASYASSASAFLFMRRSASLVSCASFIGNWVVYAKPPFGGPQHGAALSGSLHASCRHLQPSTAFRLCFRGPFSLEGLCPRQQTAHDSIAKSVDSVTPRTAVHTLFRLMQWCKARNADTRDDRRFYSLGLTLKLTSHRTGCCCPLKLTISALPVSRCCSAIASFPLATTLRCSTAKPLGR